MGTVYAFFADGFEEIEAFTAIDTLKIGRASCRERV